MDVKLDDIKFGYNKGDEALVLKGIDGFISKPQVVSILGPNGGGKTTLIHCIDKILEPNSGAVFIDGDNVSDITLKNLSKMIGYVPCSSSETPQMTVIDYVLMGRFPHNPGWRIKDEDLEIAYATLDTLQIHDLASRNVNELSAGQHQKVVLARGLAQKPRILLLDEPTANLDIKHQLGISRMLRGLSRSEEMLVIMVSHDLNIAAQYSDNIMLMKDGKVFAAGSPDSVLTVDNIRDVYGVDCKIIEDEGRTYILLKDEVPTDTSDTAICSMDPSYQAIDGY